MSRLRRVLEDAFASVWLLHQRQGLNLRTAASVLACQRILEARRLRGLFPYASSEPPALRELPARIARAAGLSRDASL